MSVSIDGQPWEPEVADPPKRRKQPAGNRIPAGPDNVDVKPDDDPAAARGKPLGLGKRKPPRRDKIDGGIDGGGEGENGVVMVIGIAKTQGCCCCRCHHLGDDDG